MSRLTLGEAHAAALEETRKIPCELAARMGLVSKGRDLGFPFYRAGKLLYTKFRVAPQGDQKKSFYRVPSGTPSVFWNLQSLSDAPSGSTLVITEGEFDAMAVLASGCATPYVVSVPDGVQVDKPTVDRFTPSTDQTAFKFLWDEGPDGVVDLIPELRPFSRFILLTDGDDKGKLLRDELAIRLGRDRCWFVTYPEGCKDANEVLIKLGAKAVVRLVEIARPIITDKLIPISGIMDRERVPYSLGWTGFDQFARFYMPELVIVTGAPNAGKSQWALNVGLNLARRHGLRGAFIQAEDDDTRIKDDVLSYARSWASSLPMDPEQWADHAIRVTKAPENIDEGEDRTLDWLLATIKEAATRHDARWVVIDPWNEFEHFWGRNENEASYLNRALKLMRSVARTYNLVLVIVAHPTKSIQGKSIDEMSLYDIAGSAAWANKADHGFILARHECGLTHVKVAKVRDQRVGGSLGIATMRFDGKGAIEDAGAPNDDSGTAMPEG
jgi:twinkle protein